LLLSDRNWVSSLLICSAPFATDVLPDTDLSKFGEIHSEERSSWWVPHCWRKPCGSCS